MSSAPAQTVPTAAETVRRATELLAVVFATAGVDDSHGILHAQQVLRNLDAALAAAEHPISAERHLACRLAALLHDADDAKYFPKTQKTCVGVGAGGNTGKGDVAGECCSTECAGSGVEREDSSGESEDSGQAGNYPNAASVAARAGAPLHVAADMLRMIACVSCSTNGNDVPPEAVDEPELLWPRWADRLEAVGEVGVARCYVYNTHVGTPLSCVDTPRPKTAQEALALASLERFASYTGGSASMLDHYYDKLLFVARPPPQIVRNRFLEEAALAGAAPLLKVCVAFGETGEVPLDYIMSLVAKHGLGNVHR